MSLFGRRPSQPVTCHFCGQSTTSPIKHKLGWLCPDFACGQYNGFTADGDYNLSQNIVDEFQCNTSCAPRHCKPAPIPFATTNQFHGDNHFDPNALIECPSTAPLCSRCQQHVQLIQQKLCEFDPGANANHNAFLQYRSMLERSYPLCAHCRTQSQYRLNTLNHNAKIWQKRQDSLPAPDRKSFSVTNSLDAVYPQSVPHRARPRGPGCPLLIRVVLHSAMCYLSFLVSIIGVCSLCTVHWETARDTVHRCDISWSSISCRDTGSYSTLCVMAHHLRAHMEGYLAILSDAGCQVVLSSTLLLLVFIVFDRATHCTRCYALFLMSNLSLILLSTLSLDESVTLWTEPLFVGLQSMMLVLCLLFITRSGGSPRNAVRRSMDEMVGDDLLNLLESMGEQDAATPSEPLRTRPGFQSDSRRKAHCKATEPQTTNQTPFFPPFDPHNLNANRRPNEWADIKLTDPFIGRSQGRGRSARWTTPPLDRGQKRMTQSARKRPRSPRQHVIGGHFEGMFKEEARGQFEKDYGRQPMDLCSPQIGMRGFGGSPLNMRRVQQRIGGLDLNATCHF